MDFGVTTLAPGGSSCYDAFDQQLSWFATNNDPLAFNLEPAATALGPTLFDCTAWDLLPSMSCPSIPHNEQRSAAAGVRGDCSSPRALPPSAEPSMARKPSSVPHPLSQVISSHPLVISELTADNTL